MCLDIICMLNDYNSCANSSHVVSIGEILYSIANSVCRWYFYFGSFYCRCWTRTYFKFSLALLRLCDCYCYSVFIIFDSSVDAHSLTIWLRVQMEWMSQCMCWTFKCGWHCTNYEQQSNRNFVKALSTTCTHLILCQKVAISTLAHFSDKSTI